MCNSYRVDRMGRSKLVADPPESVARLLEGEIERLIRPTLSAPVLLADGSAEMMRWGFWRAFNRSINNTRSDKLHTAMWAGAFEARRCLIPLASFFEYTGPTGHKQAHEFTAADDGMLWCAGIWEENETHGRCFSMIMTDANPFVSVIHRRMPALLPYESTPAYLLGGSGAFLPAAVDLAVADVANPLEKKPPSEQQPELF